MRAMVKAIAEQPQLNARFDDEAGIIHRHAGVHIGIATQTAAGLMVPVVRHAEARDLWDCAAEVDRLAEAARAGTATREELTGSTITITSLGALGGIVTTPVINHPEVAIVGVNKIVVRPVWDGAAVRPAQDDEPVVELRPPRRRRLGRRGVRAAHQGAARDAGHDLHRRLSHEGDLLPSCW